MLTTNNRFQQPCPRIVSWASRSGSSVQVNNYRPCNLLCKRWFLGQASPAIAGVVQCNGIRAPDICSCNLILWFAEQDQHTA